MSGDVLNILSGFMKGKNKRRQEDLQLQQLKLQTQRQVSTDKRAAIKEKRDADKDIEDANLRRIWFDILKAHDAGQGATPGESEGAPMAPSITDELSKVRLGEMLDTPEPIIDPVKPRRDSLLSKLTPYELAVGSKVSGMDMMGAGRLGVQIDSMKLRESQHGDRMGMAEKRVNKPQPVDMGTYISWRDYAGNEIKRDPKPFRGVMVPGKDVTGAETLSLTDPNIYPGAATTGQPGLGGQPPSLSQPTLGATPSIQTAPPTGQRRVTESDLAYWIDPKIGKAATWGDNSDDLTKRGYVRIAQAQLAGIKKISIVEDIIKEVELLMNGNIPKEEGPFGKVMGMARGVEAYTQITKRGVDLAVMRDFIDGTKAMVAKSLGEVGNLSEQEQEAVKRLYGDITDRGEKAWASFEQLKKIFANAKARAYGIDLPETGTLPAEAMKQLKEGVKTTFGNGQVWTLTNGKAARVQ